MCSAHIWRVADGGSGGGQTCRISAAHGMCLLGTLPSCIPSRVLQQDMTLRLRCICSRPHGGGRRCHPHMRATCRRAGRAGPPQAAHGQLQRKLLTWDRARRVRKLAAPGTLAQRAIGL